MNFTDMFSLIKNVEIACHICKTSQHIVEKQIHFPKHNKFLIIRINLAEIEHNAIRLKTKITNFECQNINIPGAEDTFKVKIAVQHIAFNENNNYGGGHYVAWINLNVNKWMMISDTVCTLHSTLPNHLEDIYYLVLEKNSVENLETLI